MKKHLKTVLAALIVAGTVAAFIYYVAKHPQTLDQIKHLPPLTLVLLVVLFFIWFIAYALVTRGLLHMYQKHMGVQENFLFNAYSSLINFFGPGQSGPIFRGAYLKKKHNLGVKQYVFTLLLYYAFYGVISVLLMFVGTRPWWQTLILIVGASAGSFVVLRWYKHKNRATIGEQPRLNLPNLGWIFAATAVQLAVQTVIYGIELHNVQAHASIGQVLAYSGVANMALFVSLTPGAIGIREAFLTFSQQLHHIDTSSIIAANIVDRAVYIVFLGVLFVLVLSLHASDKLSISSLNLKQRDEK
jgi:uncharacterized membrane protein YbhN (UPF0104 family)